MSRAPRHASDVCVLLCTIFKVLILSFLKIVAVYPPTSGPSTSMYGNVPGYEGTLAGGGKFTAYSLLILSQLYRDLSLHCQTF